MPKDKRPNGPLASLEASIDELKALQDLLQNLPETTYKSSALEAIGIEVSNLDLEAEKPDSRFFSPLPKDRFTSSVCSQKKLHIPFPTKADRRANGSDYQLGQAFASLILPSHMFESVENLDLACQIGAVDIEKYELATWSSEETETESETEDETKTGDGNDDLKWTVADAFYTCPRKPHRLLTLNTDYEADNDALVRSELISAISFMLVTMCIEMLKMKNAQKSKRARQQAQNHIISPVMVFSVTKPLQVRAIKAYFDAGLEIRYSKLYDFNTIKHREPMDVFMHWMISRAKGNTKWLAPLPTLVESEEEEYG